MTVTTVGFEQCLSYGKLLLLLRRRDGKFEEMGNLERWEIWRDGKFDQK
jgi:hypothetical protein